jgi:hypothetical protein
MHPKPVVNFCSFYLYLWSSIFILIQLSFFPRDRCASGDTPANDVAPAAQPLTNNDTVHFSFEMSTPDFDDVVFATPERRANPNPDRESESSD